MKILSIPFIGFKAMRGSANLSNIFIFQFPLLGSWRHSVQYFSRSLYCFQFPLLGSQRPLVAGVSIGHYFQFPLLGSLELLDIVIFWRGLQLSIPFIGFYEITLINRRVEKEIFQFPLLGSEPDVVREAREDEINFQFPLLGSI